MLPIIGDIINAGVNLFKSYFPPDLTPEQKAKLEAGAQEFKKAITAQLIAYNQAVIEQQASIIRTEAGSDSWIAKSWRPISMLVFVFIVANNYIIYPYLSLFWDKAPELQIPAQMWELLKIGFGGYVVGRSIEKSIKYFRKGGENAKGN